MASETLRVEAMPVTTVVFLRLCIALQCLLPDPAIKSSVGNEKPSDLHRSAFCGIDAAMIISRKRKDHINGYCTLSSVRKSLQQYVSIRQAPHWILWKTDIWR
jgi:hypothetical protein